MSIGIIFILFFHSLSHAFSPNPTLQSDDRQPGIMTFLNFDREQHRLFLQPYLESTSIEESVYSFSREREVTVREIPTYSVNLGYSYDKHNVGVQFGATYTFLIPYAINLNYQYDIYKTDTVLLGLSAMYGGINFPGERYGLQAIGAYKINSLAGFMTLQYTKNRRNFYSAARDNESPYFVKPDNGLSYQLQSVTTTAGLRYWNSLIFKASIELSVGWENNVVLSQSNIRFQPINYSRSDGSIFSLSVILPFEHFQFNEIIRGIR